MLRGREKVIWKFTFRFRDLNIPDHVTNFTAFSGILHKKCKKSNDLRNYNICLEKILVIYNANLGGGTYSLNMHA